MTKRLWGTVRRSLREQGARDMAGSNPLQPPDAQLTPAEAEAVLEGVAAAMKEYGGGRPGSHLTAALVKLREIAGG